jgi:hypothetical protein
MVSRGNNVKDMMDGAINTGYWKPAKKDFIVAEMSRRLYRKFC